MGSKYASQVVAGYNAAPPPDDGSAIAANKISWATIKTKLPDPILLLAQGVNTALLSALDVSNTAQTTAYTTLAADHQKPIEISSGAPVHLASAASVGVGYQVTVVNTDLSLSSTVDLALAANTFDGSVAGSAVLAPGQSITVAVNVSINGYYTVARGWGRGGFIVQEQVQFNAAVAFDSAVSITDTLTVTGPSSGANVSIFKSFDTANTALGIWQRIDGAVSAQLTMIATGSMQFGTSTAHPMTFMSAAVDRLKLTVDGGVGLVDGIAAPATDAVYAQLYVDIADGDLKIKFGDGTIKTIVVDT